MHYLVITKRPDSRAKSVRAVTDAQIAMGASERNFNGADECLRRLDETGAGIVGYTSDPGLAERGCDELRSYGCDAQVEEGDPPPGVAAGEVNADILTLGIDDPDDEPSQTDAEGIFRPDFRASQAIMVLMASTDGDLVKTGQALHSLAQVTEDDVWIEAIAAFRMTFGGHDDD